MKQYQYDEATRLTRRLTLNSALTLIVICVLSFGSMAAPIQAGQKVVMRLTAAFALAMSAQTR